MGPLPQPNEHFHWVQAAAGPALVCPPLEEVAVHLFTTRGWRLGSPEAAGDEAGWREVAGALDPDARQLVRVHQVHGAAVVRAGAFEGAFPDADIVVGDDPTQVLAVQAADCVPLLLADRRTRAVAAAHAGWRGLAARVPAAAVAALTREFGSRSADLVAAIGPSIGACCYEVGAEVAERFVAAGFSIEERQRWFLTGPASSIRNRSMAGLPQPIRADHWFFDSWAAARDQLVAAGLSHDQVFSAELCTASHPATLCSYRRDGAPAGRMAAAIRCGPRRP